MDVSEGCQFFSLQEYGFTILDGQLQPNAAGDNIGENIFQVLAVELSPVAGELFLLLFKAFPELSGSCDNHADVVVLLVPFSDSVGDLIERGDSSASAG